MALQKAYIDVPAPREIRPQGENSKYSKNLYRWLHSKDTRNLVRVYRATKGRFIGSLWIGLTEEDGSWLNGTRLISAFHSKKKTWAIHSKEWGLRDITKKFWRDYLAYGACSVHGWHHHWIPKGKTKRYCKHCGKVEVQRTVITKEKVWKDDV